MRNEKQKVPDVPTADERKWKASTQGQGQETAREGANRGFPCLNLLQMPRGL